MPNAFLLLLVASVCFAQPLDGAEPSEEHMFQFSKFVQKFDKKYSEDEFHKRFANFREAYDYIAYKNAQNNSYTLRINQFADMTKEERDGMRGTSVPSWLLRQNQVLQVKNNATFLNNPASVDWCSKGACNAIKYQGHCGSCWAFSSIAAIESLEFIKKGHLLSLSEQQLVDCADPYGGQGCHSGKVATGSRYAVDNAICLEEDYPYQHLQGKCRSKACQGQVQTTGYHHVQPNNQDAMLDAVSKQPIIVAIDASSYDFEHYGEGILHAPCGTDLDHGVLVVGYGSEDGQDYWKIRNSWSTIWGEAGYGRMQRGGAGSEGYCGILKIPVAPEMEN